MKNIVVLLCLAFIALSEPVSAQNQPATVPEQDTMAVKLTGRNQIFITGKSLRKLTGYQRADSLKAYFFADLQKTLAAHQFPETPKRIHYLVNQAGKRRLKAEVAGETEAAFDLAFEKIRMKQDLPELHYTIYDLPHNVEIHFFLEDSLAFKNAANTNLTAALQEMNKNRKKLPALTTYRVASDGFGVKSLPNNRKASLSLSTSGSAGAMILGNQPTPIIGYDVNLTVPNFNRKNYLRLAFSYNVFVLTDFTDGQFRNLNPGHYWQGGFQFSYDKRNNTWFGISAGQLRNEQPNGLPKNAFKWGLAGSYGSNNFGFDLVHLTRKTQVLMLTYKRTIF